MFGFLRPRLHHRYRSSLWLENFADIHPAPKIHFINTLHSLNVSSCRTFNTTNSSPATPTNATPFIFPALPHDHPFIEKLTKHPSLVNAIMDMNNELTKKGIDLKSGQAPDYATMIKMIGDKDIRDKLERVRSELSAAGLEGEVKEFAKKYGEGFVPEGKGASEQVDASPAIASARKEPPKPMHEIRDGKPLVVEKPDQQKKDSGIFATFKNWFGKK